MQLKSLAFPRPEWAVFWLLELGALAVFWLFDAPPFMDFALHSGVMAMHLRYEDSAVLQHYFILTPNIGGYPLFRVGCDVLAGLFGPLTAMRLISSIPALALPLAMHHARRQLHDDNGAVFPLVALILSFGYMTQIGLTPLLIAFPVIVWAMTDWLIVLQRRGAGPLPVAPQIRLAMLALLAVLLHGYAFAVLAFMMVVAVFSGRPLKPRLTALWVLLPAAAYLAFSAFITSNTHLPPDAIVPQKPFAASWGTPFDKLGLLTWTTLTTRTGIDIATGVLIWIGAVLGLRATLKGSPASHSRTLRNVGLALLAAFLLLPHRARMFDAIDSRLVPLIALSLLMAIDIRALHQRWQRPLAVAAAAAAAITVGLQLFAMQAFQREAAGYHAIFAQMPPASRLLYLPVQPDSRIFISHPFVHYDKLAFIERGVLPSQFHFHHGSGIFPRGGNPILRLPPDYVTSNLKRIDWPKYRLTDWDFVLIRTFPDAASPPVPGELSPVDHRGGWWLYRTPRNRGAKGGANN